MVKRVCFVSARCGYVENKTCQIDFADGRLFNEIKKQFHGDLGLAIFSDSKRRRNYTLSITGTEIIELPFPLSYLGGLRNTVRIYRILKEAEKKYDAFIIQLPIISFLPLLFLNKPIVFHVCANALTAANNPLKYKGYYRLSAIAFAYMMHIIHKMLFKSIKNKLIVNGNELGSIYSSYNPSVIVSSSLYSEEVLLTKISKNYIYPSSSFNLVFVGRPSLEKGFDMLIQVFLELCNKNYNVKLSLVGIMKQDILDLAKVDSKKIMPFIDKIKFYGFVPWGEELKSILLQSDCLLMCSISEGTPRVLMEARAFGCPVIATDVGGVSTSITNMKDGYLVEQGNSHEMVKLVEYLINNPLIREKVVNEGLITSRKYSIESMAKTFISAIATLNGV